MSAAAIAALNMSTMAIIMSDPPLWVLLIFLVVMLVFLIWVAWLIFTL